jgi:hypothetical protein
MTTPNPSQTPRPSAFVSRRGFIQLGLVTLGAAWLGTWLQTRLFPNEDTSQEARPVFPIEANSGGWDKDNRLRRSLGPGGARASLRAFAGLHHLGCTVEWQGEKEGVLLPCHDGRFDEFGDVWQSASNPAGTDSGPVGGETVTVGEV